MKVNRRATPLVVVMALIAALGVLIGTGGAGAAPRKALINASTVIGPLSQEEQIASALGFAVTIVDDSTWASLTAADFGQYDLLIAGDPFCGALPPGLVSSAPVFGPVVLGAAGGRTSAGNRIVVGTDPALHDDGDFSSPGARGTIIRDGIGYAGSQPGRTGMYFDSTCDGSTDTLAVLDAISAGSGSWTLDAVPPCGGSVSLVASNPSFADLTTDSLQGWDCSVHEAFPTFASDWSALAVATDTATTPTCGVDPGTGLNACGEAYILIAGSSIVVSSQVISVSPLTSTNPVGTSHTVTANVHAIGGSPPVVGQLVGFSVTGQNAGATGTCVPADCKSDVNGNVAFTYSDGAGAGDDTIKASFTDNIGSLQTATAQKHWAAGPPTGLAISSSLNPPTVNAPSLAQWKLDVSNGSESTLLGVSVDVKIDAGSFDVALTNQNSPGAACKAVAAVVASPVVEMLCKLGDLTGGAHVVVNALIGTDGLADTTINAHAEAKSTTPADIASADAVLEVDPPIVGQNAGFVPGGGSISTGKVPTPDNNTVITVTLPKFQHQASAGIMSAAVVARLAATSKLVRSPGAALSVFGTDGASDPTFCGDLPCDGKIMTLEPFTGYGDPTHPVTVVLKWLAGLVGTSTVLYFEEPGDTSGSPVPVCAKKVALRTFPCLLKHVVIKRTGAVTDTVLLLSSDPSFARRR